MIDTCTQNGLIVGKDLAEDGAKNYTDAGRGHEHGEKCPGLCSKYCGKLNILVLGLNQSAWAGVGHMEFKTKRNKN